MTFDMITYPCPRPDAGLAKLGKETPVFARYGWGGNTLRLQ